MKKSLIVLTIFGLSIFIASCDQNITYIKNFLPTHWIIMGMERDSLNITKNIDLNTFTFKSNGKCSVPRMLDGQLLLGDGEWEVERVKNKYSLILNVPTSFMTDTFTIYFQTDTVDNIPSISMLLESKRTKVWAIKQGEIPNAKKMIEMEKINNEK